MPRIAFNISKDDYARIVRHAGYHNVSKFARMATMARLDYDPAHDRLPRDARRWRTASDALADMEDVRKGKKPSRYILPGHDGYDTAAIACGIVWMKNMYQIPIPGDER